MTRPTLQASAATVSGLGIARALWYVDRGLVAVTEEPLPQQIAPGEVLVRTLYSAISRGTERLVFLGAVPESEWQSMRAPMQSGNFPFPVKYGYCAVGIIESGPRELEGHVAFCLHPHQDRFVAPASAVHLVPVQIPPRRATLAANMETAINALWDGQILPGDRVNVIGAGIVGLLTAYLAGRVAGTEVTVVDVSEARRALCEKLGLRFAGPGEMPMGVDLVVHTSASATGLQSAIDCAGMEARIVEMSWYGAREVGVSLGGAFHSKRLRLVSTQVGHVAGINRARWNFHRRLAKAIELLDDPALDVLVPHDIPFAEAERRLPAVFSDHATGLPPVLRYDGS